MSQVEQDIKAPFPIPFVSGFCVAQALVFYTLLILFLLLSLCWLPYRMWPLVAHILTLRLSLYLFGVLFT